jgi:hypothetical protein
MATSKLTELAQQRSASELQVMSRQSLDWLRKKMSQIRNPVTVANSIARENFRKTTNARIGKLYFFYYDPKTKDELPYYDRFPLVLVLDKHPDGFLGLNLHYLPYRYRVAFLNKLMRFAIGSDEDEIQRLRITYDILSASKTLREFRPCIKKYLNGQLMSSLLTIQPDEWEVATLLPIQQFRGAVPQEVWQESLEKIRKV